MTSGSSYIYPHLRTESYSSLEIGHATTFGQSNNAGSSAYLIFSTQTTPRHKGERQKDIWFSVVADAAYNDPASNVASQFSAESLYYYLTNTNTSFVDMHHQLDSAFQHTNYELLKIANQENSDVSFCASLLAAAILDGSLFLASAGNCQAYLMRNDCVHRLTYESINHPAVKARNALFPARPLTNEPRRCKTQFLGENRQLSVRHFTFATRVEPKSNIELPSRRLVNHLALVPEDVVVLCTNEVATLLGHSKIETISTLLAPQEAAEEITQLAAEAKPDINCSTIVLRWNGDSFPAETYSKQYHIAHKAS